MDTIKIKIDAELAREYIGHYRQFCPDEYTVGLDDNQLLTAFVHDRLREEIGFIVKEIE